MDALIWCRVQDRTATRTACCVSISRRRTTSPASSATPSTPCGTNSSSCKLADDDRRSRSTHQGRPSPLSATKQNHPFPFHPPCLRSRSPPRLPFPPLLPTPFLRSSPIKSSCSKGIWGSTVSSFSGVWGGAPDEIEFGAF